MDQVVVSNASCICVRYADPNCMPEFVLEPSIVVLTAVLPIEGVARKQHQGVGVSVAAEVSIRLRNPLRHWCGRRRDGSSEASPVRGVGGLKGSCGHVGLGHEGVVEFDLS